MTYLIEYIKKNGKTVTLHVSDKQQFEECMNSAIYMLSIGTIISLNVELIE